MMHSEYPQALFAGMGVGIRAHSDSSASIPTDGRISFLHVSVND